MDRTLIISQCFCNADILQFSLENLYKYGSGNWEHWILLKHYPINYKENEEKIKAYAKFYNCKIHDCLSDNGAHLGLNHFFQNNKFPKGTRYIGFDPDTLTKSYYFDIVMNQVMDADPTLGILALSNGGVNHNCMYNSEIEIKFNGLLRHKKVIAGHNVIIHPGVDMMNCCMIDIDWIMSNGGFHQPRKFYGFIENSLHKIMKRTNRKLGYLIDYLEAYDGRLEAYKHDEYKQWKNEHLGGYDGSLRDWLIREKKEHLL